MNRRSQSRPVAKQHDKTFLCLQSSEIFEEKDCFGKKHIELSGDGMQEVLVGDWITV